MQKFRFRVFWGLLLLISLFETTSTPWARTVASFPPTPNTARNCYPWGGTEGPAGGIWYYANKEVYLKQVLTSNLVLMAGNTCPILRPRG